MIFLWRKGEEKYFEIIYDGLEIVDLSMLDRFTFDYATVHVNLPSPAFRLQGLYKHKSVEASVFEEWTGKMGNTRIYRVKIKFEKIFDAKEFLSLLIGGKIWPQSCLNDKQLPSPARHLKELLREAMGIVRRSVSDRFHRIRYTI